MKLNLTKGGKQVDLNELFSQLDLTDASPLFDYDEEYAKAMDKINRLVNVRERTVKELRERLLASGFEPCTVEKALCRALECGIIDEDRYAVSFINGKVNAGWGREKIVMRLENDGVAPDVIARHEDCFRSYEGEFSQAMRELSKKQARSKNPKATLMRRLLGKGYSFELASRAVDEYMASEHEFSR